MKFFRQQLEINLWNFIARIGLVVFFGLFFFCLGLHYFVLWGNKVVETKMDKKSPYVSIFSPLDRVGQKNCENNDCFQGFIAEPVYFDLLTTVRFKEAKSEFIFKLENQPILELGVAANQQLSSMKLYPLKNQILEDLIASSNWNVVQQDDLYLLQKEKRFDYIADFLSAVPYDKKVAFYNYDFEYNYQLADYKTQIKEQSLPLYTRGSQNIYFYVKDEPFIVDLNFADLNEKIGADEISINLYPSATKDKLWSIRLDDDGNQEGTSTLSDDRKQKVEMPDISNGVYRLEIVANDDVVLKDLTTKLQKIVFDRKLYFLSQDKIKKLWPKLKKMQSLELYTSGKTIFAQAFEPEALQQVSINGERLDVKERVTLFKSRSDTVETKKIVVPKRGILIQADGLLALSEKQFFNHQPYNFRAVLRPAEVDYDFILARYTPPLDLGGGWYLAQPILNLKDAYYQKRQVKFMFSAPGLVENNGRFYLSNMKFNLVRK